MINETAKSEEWKTMGGETYTSDKMNDVLTNSYSELMSDNSNGNLAAEMGVNPKDAPDFLTKDYRAVMKKIDDKKGKVYPHSNKYQSIESLDEDIKRLINEQKQAQLGLEGGGFIWNRGDYGRTYR